MLVVVLHNTHKSFVFATTMTIISNTIRAAARASVPNRALSSTPAAPRMHKAKDAWKDIAATRPHEGHPHLVFEGDYSKVTVGAMVLGVLTLGYGSMYFGMRHQQYKAGYWK